jgi:hypothetical protein
MSEKKSFLPRMWESQYGKQYGITAIVSGASGALLAICAYQLLFLQDHSEWSKHTGLGIDARICFDDHVSLVVSRIS